MKVTLQFNSEHKHPLSKNTHIYTPKPHPHAFHSVMLVLQIPIHLHKVHKIEKKDRVDSHGVIFFLKQVGSYGSIKEILINIIILSDDNI